VDINDAGPMILAGNWNPLGGDTLTVVKSGATWFEVARSDN
jgi:hypothetical protein